MYDSYIFLLCAIVANIEEKLIRLTMNLRRNKTMVQGSVICEDIESIALRTL